MNLGVQDQPAPPSHPPENAPLPMPAPALRVVSGRPLAAQLSWWSVLVVLAVLAAVTLFKLRFLSHTPFILYFATIVAATWVGGWRLGALSTVASAVIGAVVFLPADGLRPMGPENALKVVVFLLEGGVITLLSARAQSSRLAAATAARDAQVSLAKLETVMNAVDDGITVQDSTGKLIYANEPAARLVGFPSASALLGASMAEVMNRFEILTSDGNPFPAGSLPGRRVLQGLPAPEQLLRFRVRGSGAERWSLV